jgi:hypothetical protein
MCGVGLFGPNTGSSQASAIKVRLLGREAGSVAVLFYCLIYGMCSKGPSRQHCPQRELRLAEYQTGKLRVVPPLYDIMANLTLT